VGVELELVHEEGDSTGIDVAAAGAHDESLEGRESHRGVNALAVLDGCNGGSVADVTGDDAFLLGLDAKEFADTLADVAVTRAVEPVATYAVLLVELVGQGIHIGVVGHGLVEGGVEDSHLRDVGQEGFHGVHALDVGRVVERGQVVAGGEGFHDFGGEAHRLVETLATVHHAMADGIQFIETAEHGIGATGQHLKDELYAGGVLLDGTLHLVLLAVQLDSNKRIGQPNLFDAAAGNDRPVIHVVKCIFNGTAAAVENKYLHLTI